VRWLRGPRCEPSAGSAKKEKEQIFGSYLRRDGELMIEVRPGEFVGETAARRGLVRPIISIAYGFTSSSRQWCCRQYASALGRLPLSWLEHAHQA